MPEHVWPALAKPPHRQPEIALARLASAHTTIGSLPPSSSTEPFMPPGALLAHAPADLDRAREEDLGGARLDQRLAHGAAAVHGPHEPLGHAGALEDLLDALADQRGERRWLEHHAVAGHQRDRHLAEGDRPGVVPGRDHADHAERLEREARPLLLDEDGQRDALVLEDPGPASASQRSESIVGSSSITYDSLMRLALLAAEQLGEIVELVDDRLRRAAHVARAVGQRQLRPEGLDARDVVDDGLNGIRADRLHGADAGAVERAERLELGGDRGDRGFHGVGL